MNLHDIKTVACYEAKTLQRSWIFRILFFLTLVLITYLQWLVQCKQPLFNQWNWNLLALASSMPLVNAYLYNIVQSLLVIFVAAELFTRERQVGPLEVIHARPVSNEDYFWGKVVGIAAVFVSLNLLSVFICFGLNVWGSIAPFNPWYSFFYILTLTFPSLIFMLGVTLWLTTLTRSRILSIFLSLCLLYVSVTVLDKVFHGNLNFLGSSLSNLFSSVTGHVDLGYYLLQRLAFFLLGCGFIVWSLIRIKRLPNELKSIPRLRLAGILFVLTVLLLEGACFYRFIREDAVREQYRASFERYWKGCSTRVSTHAITLRQKGEHLELTSEMVLRNSSGEKIPRLVLFLNPGLRVTSVKEGDKTLTYERDHQVLLIDRPLEADDSVRLDLIYKGTIDERVCYLEVPDPLYYDTGRNDPFFHFGRRYAFVSNTFLLLVPENIWYPVAIPPVNPKAPWLSIKDFTRYSLAVVNPVQSTLLSQGPSREEGDTLWFQPPFPLGGLSISGGDYERYTLKLKSCDLDLYYFKGSDVLSSLLKDYKPEEMGNYIEKKIADLEWHTKVMSSRSLFDSISEMVMRRDWCGYPSSRLIVAETPLPFISHFREWTGKSEFVQSGMALFSERGVGMKVPDYRRILKQNADNAVKMASYNLSPEFLKLSEMNSLLSPFISCFLDKTGYSNRQNLFLSRLRKSSSYAVDRSKNLFDSYTLFREPQSYIYSVDYPTVDLLLKNILRDRSQIENIYQQMSSAEYMAQAYLLSHSLEDAMQDETLDPDVLRMALQLETRSLLNHFTVDISMPVFCDFLNDFCKKNQGIIPLEKFTSELNERFGVDFTEVLEQWSSKSPTHFLVRDMEVNKIEEGAGMHIRFKIKNSGKSKGLVSVLYGATRSTDSYNFYLNPDECKEVSIQGFFTGNFQINTGVSYNIPGRIAMIKKMDQVSVSARVGQIPKTICSLSDIHPDEFLPKSGEIIVDNEDPGFRLIEPDKTFFRRLFENKDENTIETSLGLGFSRWQKVVSPQYLGDSVRSAYCKECKNGKYKAEWKALIPEAGSYEVFVFLPELPSNYHYTVYCGQEEQEVWAKAIGWFSLGTYDFPKGEAKVVLDDRRMEDYDFYVIADAVKWVKVD
ncbi:ABC transporter permease subunit [uncultured Sanguibacteroides sp.]|uniref:golvesin C-terminal-like domain-containing protein n=1 Tax=uncultured Sanguibacteroides sp. TaxID=1635151 RepID=UPI0025DF4AF0|nr:ABC transporter permease subunit [uncultured Sanguibacteroides sp.]